MINKFPRISLPTFGNFSPVDPFEYSKVKIYRDANASFCFNVPVKRYAYSEFLTKCENSTQI